MEKFSFFGYLKAAMLWASCQLIDTSCNSVPSHVSARLVGHFNVPHVGQFAREHRFAVLQLDVQGAF